MLKFIKSLHDGIEDSTFIDEDTLANYLEVGTGKPIRW